MVQKRTANIVVVGLCVSHILILYASETNVEGVVEEIVEEELMESEEENAERERLKRERKEKLRERE